MVVISGTLDLSLEYKLHNLDTFQEDDLDTADISLKSILQDRVGIVTVISINLVGNKQT